MLRNPPGWRYPIDGRGATSNPSAKRGLASGPRSYSPGKGFAIVRTLVRMRELMESTREIAVRVEKLERGHDRAASGHRGVGIGGHTL